jgi:putative hemolysin
MKTRLGIDDPLPLETRYNTVAGMLMAVSGRLLAQGDSVRCGSWMFLVLSLEGRRLVQIKATHLDAQAPL